MTTRGYLGQVFEVRPVLAAMEDRGMPIDDAARIALDAEFTIAQRALGEELAAAAPAACRRVHPKDGYKGMPPEVKEWQKQVGLLITPNEHRFQEKGDGEQYIYEVRTFNVAIIDPETGEPTTVATTRWARVYDFNPNSSQQLLAYMDARGHKRPKSRKNEDDDGNARDTTAKKDLQRLAYDHDDPFYLRVIEYRELSKARGTYIDGFKPGADGCVHTAFGFAGTGQLTSRNPNVQNFPKHGRLAKALRRMIAPPPSEDRVVIELDYRAFHVLMTGFAAESANWMRLARLDMHSFVAWHFMKLPSADGLFVLADDDLSERLEWFKSDPKRAWVRDKQAKPSDLGIGFGMGPRRLFQENMEYFDGEREARKFHDMLHGIFPDVICVCRVGERCDAWQHRVRFEAHEKQRLTTPFGHHRRFYEVFRWDAKRMGWAKGDQAEEAVAFVPANLAHGHLREVMKDMRRAGHDDRYRMGDQIHDALVFFPRREEADACLADVSAAMTAPSRVISHPTLAPGGLWCGVDAKIGPNWAGMEKVKIRATTTKGVR
jgi:hypothetical protein